MERRFRWKREEKRKKRLTRKGFKERAHIKGGTKRKMKRGGRGYEMGKQMGRR